MFIPKCGGGFHIRLLYFVRFGVVDALQAGYAPVAKQPEVVVVPKLFYLFLMICHVDVEQMLLRCETSKCCCAMTWGNKQWGVCRASCGAIPMARFDAIDVFRGAGVTSLQALCIQVEKYKCRVQHITSHRLLCS